MIQIVLDLQQKLSSLHYDPGPLDGVLGVQTYGAFLSALVQRDLGQVAVAKGQAFSHLFPMYHLMTPRRISHFCAQCAEETAGYHYFVELGGPSYFAKYDGRLGNVRVGDGYRYRGRGDIQITGRNNYAKYGARLGLDLLGNPDRAAEPEIATTLACLYWVDNDLSALADSDEIEAITRRINGGLNGLATRKAYLQRARSLWGY